MRGILIAVLVIGAIVGLLLTLRTSRNAGMPGPDVMARAKSVRASGAAAERDD